MPNKSSNLIPSVTRLTPSMSLFVTIHIRFLINHCFCIKKSIFTFFKCRAIYSHKIKF